MIDAEASTPLADLPALSLTRTADACLFCGARRCILRYWTENLLFDEVACWVHEPLLEGYIRQVEITGPLRKETGTARRPLRRTHSRRYRLQLAARGRA